MENIFSGFAPVAARQTTVHAELFRSGLDDRFLGGLVDFPGRTSQCILVLSGRAYRLKPESEDTIVGPAINWGPKSPDTRIKAKAGSNGVIMTLGDATLSNTIGHKPEAATLRLMSAREFTLNLAAKPAILGTITACFDAMKATIEKLTGEIAALKKENQNLQLLAHKLWDTPANIAKTIDFLIGRLIVLGEPIPTEATTESKGGEE